jgi:glycerol-3-phosphate cytidylyltransferase
MIYCFDIDGTICHTEKNYYKKAKPIVEMISKINSLYDEGHHIIMFTARGAVSKIDWHEYTKRQLDDWGVMYHELVCNKKPHFDLLVDDKAITASEWQRQNTEKKIGFLAGAFDILHPGYIEALSKAKNHCSHLVVALHKDPSQQRPQKLKPIFSPEEREQALLATKFVDRVIHYETEKDLYDILKNENISIRFLGDDYVNKEITGGDLDINIIYLERDHGWSYTKVRELINEQN